MKQERIVWLDVARGIGILLVVFGHICLEPHAASFVYSFHMPLFFFLAGMTRGFSGNRQCVRRRAARLLLPYFFFSIVCFAYWALIESRFRPGQYDVTHAFMNIFLAQGDGFIYNSVLWFLPCLFVLETVLARHMLLANILCGIVVAAYFITNGNPSLLGMNIRDLHPLWMLDAALAALPFYVAGFYLNRFFVRDRSCRYDERPLVKIILISCCLVFVFLCSQPTDLARLIFPSADVFFTCSMTGIFAVVLISKISVKVKIFQYLGTISLYLMCIHEPIKRIVLKIANNIFQIPILDMRNSIVLSIMLTMVVVLVCMPLCAYILRLQTRFTTPKRITSLPRSRD